MTNERRQYPRVVRPFDAKFGGSSGATRCVISDISLGGCFVETAAKPAAGETVSVTATIGGETIELRGVVVYVDSTIGVAVRFTDVPPAVLRSLQRLLDALAHRGISA